MAKPLYDRTTAKPLRLDTPRPLKGVRIGARNRHRLGFVAAGLAALTIAGAVALAIRPSAVRTQPASLHPVSRGADAARKVQVVKTAGETPVQRRPDPLPPAAPVAVERAAAPPVPAPAEARSDTVASAPASGAPAIVASLEPSPVQPRGPEPSAPPEAGPKSAVATTAAAPLDCVAGELRTVLADVAARFGTVSVVSTHRLNSDNHTPGTIRHRLHTACKAVDFRTSGKLNEVLGFLRSRPEVSGINSYRGGLIHIDLNENVRAAGLRARPKPTFN